MKIIHTSDLHIGRDFYGHDLREYQQQALAGLLQILRKRQPDALLISGDVLDKTNPADTDVNLLSDFITQANESCQVVLISGNHDGASRLGFLSGLLDREGVHIVTAASQVGRPIEIYQHGEPGGKLAGLVYPVPYLYPFQDREVLSTWVDAQGDIRADAYLQEQATHEPATEEKRDLLPGKPGVVNAAALRRIGNDILARGRDLPLVGMAHDNFTRDFTPAEPDIAKYAVGSLANVDNTMLATLGSSVPGDAGLDYFALGHIHKCYPVVRTTGFQAWYSGSPLPYTTNDTNQKYVLEVEIDATHRVQVEQIPLEVPYQVAEFTDSFEALKDPHNPKYIDWHQAFCSITLSEDYLPDNALNTIRSVFPRMTQLHFSNRLTGSQSLATTEVSPLDFATDFLKSAGCSETAVDLFQEIFQELGKGGTK